MEDVQTERTDLQEMKKNEHAVICSISSLHAALAKPQPGGHTRPIHLS